MWIERMIIARYAFNRRFTKNVMKTCCVHCAVHKCELCRVCVCVMCARVSAGSQLTNSHPQIA